MVAAAACAEIGLGGWRKHVALRPKVLCNAVRRTKSAAGLLLTAFRGVATKHLDSFMQCFERVDSSRPTPLRACLAADSTQPRIRLAN